MTGTAQGRFFLLALVCVAAAGQTRFTVTPSELTFAAVGGSSTAMTATLAVAAQNGDAAYTASIRYLSNPAGWLNISPATGMTPGSITVTANPSQLPVGTHSAQITVAVGGLGRAVNVTMVVGASPGAPGTLLVNPTALTFFGGTAGEASAPPRELTVTTPAGSTPVTFRAVAAAPWISVPPMTFTTPATVPVIAFQTGLAAGTYSGGISLIPTQGGSPTVVPVTLRAAGTASQFRTILSQTAIQFNYQLGTSVPTTQPVFITTSIPGTPVREFTAATATPWLYMNTIINSEPSQQVNFITGYDLNVLVDPTGLAPGTYTGNIVVTVQDLPPVQLPVTLHVSTVAELNARPSSVVLGETPLTLSAAVDITSTGNTPLTFSVQSTSPNDFLRVSAPVTSTANGTATILLSASANGLPIGSHDGSVTLTANNGSVLTIPVRLDVATAATQSTLFVVPTSISLTGTRGLQNPSQILQIGTEIGSFHSYTVSAASTEGWLTLDSNGGNAPGRVTVVANMSVLPGAGTYSGVVTVTSLLTQQTIAVPVTLQVQDNTLNVSPGTLSFTQPRRFGPFDRQRVQITSPLPNQRFRFLDVPSWLRVSDLSGTAPMTVEIWPEVTLLPPGSNFTTSIRIEGPNNTISLPISAALAPAPALTVTPEPVSLTYALGGPVIPSEVLKVDTGGEPNPFSVKVSTESGRNWLKVTPLSGTTPAELRVIIDPALVTTGRLNGTIDVMLENGSGQIKSVPVLLAVNPPAAVVEAVLHGATQSPTPVAPGLMLTITGYGFGPVTAVTPRPTAAGAYETRVADTRVLFDGIPAPILYLRSDQVNVIAPYALYGRSSTRMQVEQAGNLWSLPVDLRVVDAQPGLFTQGGSGRGQASAVNQDFTPNSSLNPAERGSVITVFGTGEGQTDPPGQDGRVIATDLRRPLLPVSALIGGRPAEVLYAGSASAMVSGTVQVNLRVPTDIPSGVLPVQIQVGNSTFSTASVTIVVK